MERNAHVPPRKLPQPVYPSVHTSWHTSAYNTVTTQDWSNILSHHTPWLELGSEQTKRALRKGGEPREEQISVGWRTKFYFKLSLIKDKRNNIALLKAGSDHMSQTPSFLRIFQQSNNIGIISLLYLCNRYFIFCGKWVHGEMYHGTLILTFLLSPRKLSNPMYWTVLAAILLQTGQFDCLDSWAVTLLHSMES